LHLRYCIFDDKDKLFMWWTLDKRRRFRSQSSPYALSFVIHSHSVINLSNRRSAIE